MHPDQPELHPLHATTTAAGSAQGASTCGGGTPSTGVATAEPSAPAAAMRTRFVSNDAVTRQPETGIEGEDAPGDDADGQACSTASAMAEPSAVVAEARARIDDRMRELSPACPYRAEIARWLRDQWPPGAEVVPPLPRHAAEIAKKAGSNATSIHDSVKSEMTSCRADLRSISQAALKRSAKEVARKRGEKEVARSADRPRSGHNVAAARAVSSGIPASGRRFSGPGNPECDCGESESCGCYCRNCALTYWWRREAHSYLAVERESRQTEECARSRPPHPLTGGAVRPLAI